MKSIVCGAVGTVLLLGASVAALSQQATQPPPPELPRFVRSDPAKLPMIYGVRVSSADLARSEKFYREALGARNISRVAAAEFMVQFQSGLVIMVSQRPASDGAAPAAPGAGGFILEVADIDAAMARVLAAGGQIVRPASATATASLGIRIGIIRDPDGVTIELCQLAATQPAIPPRPVSQ